MEIVDIWVSKFFEHTTFEAASVMTLVLIDLWLCYWVLSILPKLIGERSKVVKQMVETETKLLKRIGQILWFIPKYTIKFVWFLIKPTPSKAIALSIILFVYVVIYVHHYYFIRPWVVYQYPEANQPWHDQKEPLRFVFNKPVDPTKLQLNFSNDLKGELVWKPAFPNSFLSDKLYREVMFYPEKTILPEEDFVVYLVGITTPSGIGGSHEHNSDFTAPKLPQVSTFDLVDGSTGVDPEAELALKLNNPTGQFADWEFALEPEAEVTYEQADPQTLILKFPEGLEQDKTYLLSMSRTIMERDVDSGEILSTFEPQTVGLYKFTTVSAALIKGVSLKGSNILTNLPLVLTFDEPMVQESVMANLSIEPSVPGEFSWNEKSTQLTFKPETLWEKNTKYTIFISNQARAQAGGKLSKDIDQNFTTVGKLKVKAINPKSNAVNVTSNKYIVVEFNQPVDRKSAKAAFSLSPSASGKISFSNKDRRLTFVPSSNLRYGTKYTIKLKAGIKSVYGLDSDESFSSSFTTQPQEFILAVPQYFQAERYTCNVASARMALAYRGVYLSEGAIKSGMGIGTPLSGSYGGDPYSDWIDGYGTYWTNVSAYIGNYRKTAIKTNWNTTDMLQAVSNGNPVILWWQNGWGSWYRKSWTTPGGSTVEGLNGMHSEVVIGYRGPISNPDYIITRDPWRGTRTYSRSYFENLWSSSFGRTAVVVY